MNIENKIKETKNNTINMLLDKDNKNKISLSNIDEYENNIKKIDIEKNKNILITKHNKNIYIYKFIAIAASIILIFGIYFFISNNKNNKNIIANNTNVIFELDNGEIILPEKENKSNVTTKYKIDNKNKIIAFSKSKNTKNNISATKQNKLIIPKGKQYSIILPDGTQVWLNSDSELTYPSLFNKHNRIVHLKGEAYFNVAHINNSTFRVKTNNIKITVTGTEFNVNSYNSTNVVLIKGSVYLNNDSNKQKTILHPGEKAIVNNKNNIIVSKTNINNEIAWRKGIIFFKKTRLNEVFKILERNYNITIINNSNNNDKITGQINRNKNITWVLDNIKLFAPIKYNIKNNIIFIENK